MLDLIIREPKESDREEFLTAMQSSQALHHPWVHAPLTAEAFEKYIQRSLQPSQKCLLVCDAFNHIVGVFNVSEIVLGAFQSGYLGYYSVMQYAGKGYMSAGLKLVLNYLFEEMKLHRIEANIQPENIASIHLVRSNGFAKEGFSPRYLKINSTWCDHERWALTYEDWANIGVHTSLA